MEAAHCVIIDVRPQGEVLRELTSLLHRFHV